ncbi:hypothetical protein BJ742DRAFT_870988 [Cladochytrium replicatum]|nr:hypothetical protein BJ742DRAFT_870988 [Cladochytrium replicatum]
MSNPAQLQQQVAALTAKLTDIAASIPAILLSGAGCLTASTVFLWTLVLLYRQRESLFGSSLNRRGIRAWFLAVAAAFNLFGNALVASSFLHSVLLTEAWFYMSAFTTSGVVIGIVTCCAVERFLIILTNKKIKWTILGLAIVANAANLTQHVILMWEPTRVALSGPNKTRPTYLPLAVLIATAIPCIVILVTGIGVFSLSLVRHLRQRKEGFTSSSSANAPSADRAIYIVLIVHHAHLISTLAVYIIFGTAIALTLNQSALRGPLAYFYYSIILALESGLEDIARTVNHHSNGTGTKSQIKAAVDPNGANSGYFTPARTAGSQYLRMNSPVGQVHAIPMSTYNQAFAQQAHPDPAPNRDRY